MNSPHDPVFRILSDLAPLEPVLWEAMETAEAEARRYFDERREPINRTLFPCLVRYRAIQVIEAAGIDAVEFARTSLSNNGIEIRHEKYRVRVLKADNGEVPRAGTSTRKRSFYCQGSLFPQREEDVLTNLILLWDYDGQGLTGLTWAHPVAAESEVRDVDVDWMQPLIHPAERVTEETVADEDEDDLPITFRRPPQEEEGAG